MFYGPWPPISVVIMPHSAAWQKDWRVVGELDPLTHHRTLRRDNVVPPTVVDIRVILRGRTRADSGWFLALRTGNVSRALTDLSRFGEERRFWRDGCPLSAYPLCMRIAL